MPDPAPDPKPELQPAASSAPELFVNPIDVRKIAANPGLLPYAHTVGGAIIKPEDMGRIKGNAIMAMEQQTDMHLGQIQEQLAVLARQAQEIQRRKEVSVMIYEAAMGFDPIINHVYHLYRRKNGTTVLSMVSPAEWGRSMPYIEHLAKALLLADHTWDVLEVSG